MSGRDGRGVRSGTGWKPLPGVSAAAVSTAGVSTSVGGGAVGPLPTTGVAPVISDSHVGAACGGEVAGVRSGAGPDWVGVSPVAARFAVRR